MYQSRREIHSSVCILLQKKKSNEKQHGEHKLLRDMIYLGIFLLHLFGILSFGPERGAVRA